MKHNDSARIGSLSKWHTFDLTGEREGRGGRYLYVFIYTCKYTSFDRSQVLRVIIQYPERCYGTTPDAR